VLDPFAGSNTSGFAAALTQRRWLGIEIEDYYTEQSLLRFKDPLLKKRKTA